MISARVICDSVAPHGKRLTTFVLEYPLFFHAELLTHRALSRNAASSRAIPVAKMLERVEKNPATFVSWGRNQKGMQAGAELSHTDRAMAEEIWLESRDVMLIRARRLEKLGIHKQVVNRAIAPWSHITTVATATEWTNFYSLRTDGAAQPEFQALAEAMLKAHNESEPELLYPGEWHLPFVQPEEMGAYPVETLLKFSVARSARVSFLTHEGLPNRERDLERHDDLYKQGHVSPFEHQGTPLEMPIPSGNFIGFLQYRKTLPHEYRNEFPRLLPKTGVRRRP